MGTDAWKVFGNSDSSWDAMHFSSSLPVLAHGKLKLNCTDNGSQFVDDLSCGKLTHDANSHAPCEFLPDDENVLLAGIMEDFDLKRLPGSLEDLEDDDIFGNSGGLELELDPQESISEDMSKISLSDIVGSPIPQYGFSNGTGTVSGEHPYGEHPSRTLFVRNINSNVEDSELRSLFEQYGAIRTMYTACKHRGFVMISYYDIRDARNAMRALQNKPLRRRKLDIHFSIPKDNPSEKDVNQGTLVIFNLDPSVTNEELLKIFGTCGEVKEIRETPQKRHHKFIEFYDVRAADAALKLLNGREIAGKRIKLEPSRPGGVRKNMMFQLNPELEQDDLRSFRHQVGSPIANSPPGNWMQFNSIEHRPLQNLGQIPGFKSSSPPTYNSHLPGLASILPHQVSNSLKIAPIGKKPDAGNYGFQHARSLPAGKLNEYPGSVSSALSTSNGSVETLSGPQFLWGNSNPYLESPGSSKSHNLGISSQFTPFLGTSQNSHHHVGSAPSGYPLQRQFSHFPESPETSFMGPSALGGSSMKMNPRAVQGNLFDNSMTNFPMLSPPRLNPMFLGGGAYQSFSPTGMEGLNDRMMRARRVESARSELESRKLFQLDLDKIVNGEDTRTTLMIKNIPNKYTSKMLLAAIDENHRGTYDFLYLPIDFKNKCNVGYAFINMLSPAHIIPFYENFNGKKWEKFNSEKVASLAYARIQGKTALIAHFQNSSLMNEDKRCRPILFHSDGAEVDDQDIFIPGLNIPANQPVRLESADSYRTRLVGSQMSSIGADFGGD